ncbi:class I SAM-dependent methyltransferase [Thermocladium modestius]|uniref:class I SAM-dependent methyltransferase n=1 Tax=Thermocladium modestius TaxID=62609 RepID=UPI001E5E071C|nr:class I SAM-dependent methyltransferase [Thermocladium modestius]
MFLGSSENLDETVAGFGVAKWAFIEGGKRIRLPGGYDNVAAILSLRPRMIYMGKSSPWFIAEMVFRGIGVHISNETISKLIRERPPPMTESEVLKHLCNKSGRFSPDYLRQLVRGWRVLDAAAGTGRYLLSLDGYLVGMDISIYALMGLLKCGEDGGKDVDIVAGSFTAPPLRSGFDAVIIMHALYRGEQEQVLRKLKGIGRTVIWGEHKSPPAAIDVEKAMTVISTLGCSVVDHDEEFIAVCL